MANASVRRSSKVGLVLTFTLVFGILFGFMPAMASAASTAFVNVHNVLAGQTSKVFSVRVNNTESTLPGPLAGKTIREVRVFPPLDLIDAVLPGSSGPGAFTDVRVIGDPPAEIRFRAPSGQGLAPGANATFTIATDVRDTITRDRASDWTVRVSDNTLTTTQASTATAEGLTTNVRVLQVQSVAVLSPAGAADDRDGDGNPEVTGTQGNICVRTSVYNAAATALDVTPGLSAGSMSVGNPRPAATPPCSAATVTSASIPAKQASSFDFVLSANDVSSKTTSQLVGTATAANSSTPDTPDADDDDFNLSRALVIEPKAKFTYITNTLAPRAVVPSDAARGFVNTETFSIGFNKTPAGSPPLPSLSGDFTSPFCNAPLATPTSLGEGALNNQVANYAECPIADLADGRYQPTVRFGYTDANGLVQGLIEPTNALEKVRLDSLIPDVDVNIVPPAAQVTAVPPVEPAVTNGQAFTANGTATDVSPESGDSVPCGPNPSGNTAPLPCTLESANLLQYPLTAAQGGGLPFVRKIDVKNLCSLAASGNITCNINLNGNASSQLRFDTGTLSTALEVIVKDETGNLSDPASSLSQLVDVDIVAPFIDTAAASRGGTVTLPADQEVQGQRRTILVSFNEPVQDSNNPQDWRVQEGGNTIAICAVNQAADKRTLQLVTCTEMPADPEGLVVYDPSLPTSNPYHDRVGQETAVPLEKTLLDRIAPLAPTFTSVNGRGVQDGSFFFNTSSPEVVLDDGAAPDDDPAIANGYTVELYKESNGQEGLQRVGDTLCGSDVAAGTTVTFSCTFGGAEGETKVYAVSLDTAIPANVGDVSVASFILDITRPLFLSAAVAGTQVTVTFTEPLYAAGRNSGNDWNFFATNNASGERQNIALGAVTAPSSSTRALAINDTRWSSGAYTPERVRYRFDGEFANERYDDRAGNQFLDGDKTF